MSNHKRDFDPPRIMLVKEVNGEFDFGLLPKDFRRFDNFYMMCAGIAVRTGDREFHLSTSHRSMLPAGTTVVESERWQERAIAFVSKQWRAYVANDFKLPAHPEQEKAFAEIMRHSVSNIGTDLMSEQEVEELGSALHFAFMQLLDHKMGLATKRGLTGRYAMGGNA